MEPFQLTSELVEAITPIDGGVLIAPQGVRYALGVILDGAATPKVDPTRGGQYNAAVRYMDEHAASIALVVSADGSVDIVPKLRPQIRRENVHAALQRLQELAE